MWKAKICSIVLLVFLSNILLSQDNTMAYSYDESGRLTQRKLQVFAGGRMANPFNSNDTIVPNKIDFSVFPNPTNEYLTIEGKLPENTSEATMNILNMNGQILKTEIYTGKSTNIVVRDLTKGMYFLEIVYSKKEKSTYKIVVN